MHICNATTTVRGHPFTNNVHASSNYLNNANSNHCFKHMFVHVLLFSYVYIYIYIYIHICRDRHNKCFISGHHL